LGFSGKFELAVLWKFRGELITFGQQTQPAFMREPLVVISSRRCLGISFHDFLELINSNEIKCFVFFPPVTRIENLCKENNYEK
jgi:hypothetical protein